MKHKRAIVTIAIAALLDVVGGLVFAVGEHVSIPTGLYWAVTEATTVGSSVTPHTLLGHAVTVVVVLTVIPLFAATFSLVTSGLTATHVRKEGDETRRHIAHHLEQMGLPPVPPKPE